MPGRIKQVRVNIDPDLHQRASALVQKQKSTLTHAVTELLTFVVSLPPDDPLIPMMFGQLRGEGRRTLAKALLRHFSGRR